MPTTLLGISYDATDASALAAFWAAALGRTVAPGASPASASVPAVDPTTEPLLMFHQVPEGKSVKNRVHLDLTASSFDDELARLQQLGASAVATFPAWTTMQDPEGNEFDLIRG